MENKSSRRKVLKQIAGTALLAGASPAFAMAGNMHSPNNEDKDGRYRLKGNINHSVCRWSAAYLSLEDQCKLMVDMGIKVIDLLKPDEWPVIKKYGLECSMCYIKGEVSLTKGFNDPANHALLVKEYLEAIPLVAEAGYKNLICFSGNRNGMDDKVGLDHCVTGLRQIMPLAEKHGVIIQMELFNSRVDHKDYMADNSDWGVALCKKLGSPNFKLLYDIYHMQVNEGDIIHRIRENHQYFGHYHVAGVPGRHEPDLSQELYYPAVMKAIADTGFKGYVAQEFIFTGKTDAEKTKALRAAVKICDI
ncbi:MAG: hydroxypyruvate isomerase [Chitinophagaceae bacterium]|nr:MAG: hydroxypyruvate isomerase [Chitinophagaceae bacterium]